MSRKATILKILLPLIIIIAALFVMKAMITSRSEPQKEVKNNPGILVNVIQAMQEDIEIVVKGTGTVSATQEVSVTPQVSGRIVSLSPRMVVGGFFEKDELLFEVEDTDYLLALEQAMGSRARAEYELATIESRRRVARAEWENLSKDAGAEPNPLVLYEPQLKNAQAALAAAEAVVEQAKLELERTRVRAPFNARVRSESIELGQYVRSGSSVAVLAGVDRAEVIVPLSLDDQQWLDIPRGPGQTKGSPAVVSFSIGTQRHEWQGHVVRSTGEVDPSSRMMQLVVEIRDPYGLRQKDVNGPALASGTFVDVRIKGRTLKSMFRVPREVYRDKGTLWIMDGENKLRIQDVVPLYFNKEDIIISSGLNDGDRIVRTNISGAADGMLLRTREDAN